MAEHMVILYTDPIHPDKVLVRQVRLTESDRPFSTLLELREFMRKGISDLPGDIRRVQVDGPNNRRKEDGKED